MLYVVFMFYYVIDKRTRETRSEPGQYDEYSLIWYIPNTILKRCIQFQAHFVPSKRTGIM